MLERLKRLDAGLEVVLVTAVRTVRTAVEAMKLGAYDYLTKPFAVDDLRSVVNRALERRALQREVRYLRDELARHEGFDQLVGRSPAMRRVYEIVRQIADTTATVLITGESGTGKELIARAIHRQGEPPRPPLRGRELRGIAAPSSSSRSCSATSGARSRARTRGSSASSRWRTPGRCSWTRSERSGSTFSRSSCGPSRSGRSSGSEAAAPSGSTSGSSPRPTRICGRRWRPAGSGRTCSIASTWCRSPCPRSATAARTWRRWPGTFWRSTRGSSPRR